VLDKIGVCQMTWAFWESSGKRKNQKFQGTKTELISILKNAHFTGVNAKS